MTKKGLNENQKTIATTFDDMMVVDAGPGTGKTQTVMDRYINLISANISPAEILTVTFTVNAAEEMRGRIRRGLVERSNLLKEGEYGDDPSMDEVRAKKTAALLEGAVDEVRTSTFDAYCLRIVLSAPEVVSDFFGITDVVLSRGASLVENDTMNREYFGPFYAEFSRKYGHRYRGRGMDYPALMAENVGDLYDMLVRLMSFGIIPKADYDWFEDGETRLKGDLEETLGRLREVNGKDLVRLQSSAKDAKRWSTNVPPDVIVSGSIPKGSVLTERTLTDVADEDRTQLIYFLWDVYHEYIRQSIRDNRLTFALVKIMAFAALLQEPEVSKQNSVSYLMVDEFQDTDEMQMMICLMLLKEPNLCVVGDWKQGIYGFRNASVDNILEFEQRVRDDIEKLGDHVRFGPEDISVSKHSLNMNYRSTEQILEPAFRAMRAPGSKDDEVVLKEGSVTELIPVRTSDDDEKHDLYRRYTGCEFWYSDDEESEFGDIVDKVTEYLYSGNYAIVDGETVRAPKFEDIGILFRTVRDCISMYDALRDRGIPAFLQGDVEIMSSVPGKLALAWLRFVNDPWDKRGIIALLTYRGFSITQIGYVLDGEEGDGKTILDRMPRDLVKERGYLEGKEKRPNDLLTSIFAYHNLGEDARYADTVQAIIRIVSSSYDGTLITIPDIIRLFEEDISNSRRYSVDAVLGTGAVTVQTMHKSKGLQYPIVVVGGVSQRKLPSQEKDRGILSYDPVFGIRCKKEFQATDGTVGIVDSWRYAILTNARRRNYDEERRLLFVSMTRAEQSMFVASGPNPSRFYHYVAGEEGYRDERPKPRLVPVIRPPDEVIRPPEIPPYARRRRNIAVHDIMEYKEGADESGKGKEYGKRVHEAAQQMALGHSYDTTLPETRMIADILSRLGGAVFMAEYDCALPVGEVTVRGVIDLMADFGDRIEIHDWKTDVDARNLDSYVVQLSVYAHAAMQARNVPVRCFVDYVSQGVSREVGIVPMEEIEDRVQDYLTRPVRVDDVSD